MCPSCTARISEPNEEIPLGKERDMDAVVLPVALYRRTTQGGGNEESWKQRRDGEEDDAWGRKVAHE
jgi:hypothetical protein